MSDGRIHMYTSCNVPNLSSAVFMLSAIQQDTTTLAPPNVNFENCRHLKATVKHSQREQKDTQSSFVSDVIHVNSIDEFPKIIET